MSPHALGKEWAEATHRTLLDRNAELVVAIHRCLESAVSSGIIGHDCFAILQAVVHDGIPAPDRVTRYVPAEEERARIVAAIREEIDALHPGLEWREVDLLEKLLAKVEDGR